MLMTAKPRKLAKGLTFVPILDPWDAFSDAKATLPTYPRVVPLDASHELTGVPIPELMMPAGVVDAVGLPASVFTAANAIALLLQEELKLASLADASLRQRIGNALTYLEFADRED